MTEDLLSTLGSSSWKLDHVAHAVRDIDQSLDFYHALAGFQLLSRETVADQSVEVAFIDTGATPIELLAPSSQNSSVMAFIDKYSEGLHHICFAVADIRQELDRLKTQQIQLIDPLPRIGAGGRSIAFLHPKSCQGVLIELCEGGHDTF